MEFPSLDLPKTVVAFLGVILLGLVAMLFTPAGEGMAQRTILVMVTPSMVLFGIVCLVIGIAHGQHRAAGA